jgi:signal transduction histidine kinase
LTTAGNARLNLAIERLPHALPAYVEYNLLRIAQEAIINAVKHAGARTIGVTLQLLPDVLRIAVEDDGAGFLPADTPADHFGLVGMKERAKEIGAELSVRSEPRMGTGIVVDFPIRKTGLEAPGHGVQQDMKAEI